MGLTNPVWIRRGSVADHITYDVADSLHGQLFDSLPPSLSHNILQDTLIGFEM